MRVKNYSSQVAWPGPLRRLSDGGCFLLLLLMATDGSSSSECGALRGSGGPTRAPTRSYGSTARCPGSPACLRYLEHRPRPGDTLQGLALRYGVSTEQIKRANRLYTNESIFLKESIRVPTIATQQETLSNGVRPEAGPEKSLGEAAGSVPNAGDRLTPELSAMDFLKRLDSKITQSKAAAIKKLKEGGAGYECTEGRAPSFITGCSSNSNPALAQRQASNQRVHLGPVRLTKTVRVTTLREKEDEIFDL